MSNQSSLPQHDNTANLNLDNIQGDVLVALPKAVEEYTFLKITNPERFRSSLTNLVHLVTSSSEAIAEREKIKRNKEEAKLRGEKAPLLPIVGLTVGFSQTGLNKIGKNGSKGSADDLGDDAFRGGMKADSQDLGDPFNPNDPKDPKWLPAWKNGVDFMVDISGDSWERVARMWYEIEEIFGIGTHQTSVEVVIKIKCNERPGKEKGHEHFGFRDGISQPAIEGFHKPLPGQLVAPPRVFLMGQEGSRKTPEWSKDGTFLAFRHLEQLVPEFDHFLEQNPVVLPGLDRKQGSELRGARFMGRWKSGAPIELSPHHDDPKLAADPNERNNFVYSPSNDQTKCPFAAHIRKCNPRNDLDRAPNGREEALLSKLLLRRGMPFGREVREDERLEHKTKLSRGLAFAAYNSSIVEGFQVVQRDWCNNPNFPPKMIDGKRFRPGFDPIVGEHGNESRMVNGTANVKPEDPNTDMTLPFDFVVPKGGEYFFIPSIAALRDEFATKDEH